MGPIFFDKSINSSEYQKIIDQFVENLDCDCLDKTFFQQDGATAHTARNTAYQLENYFANRLISKSNRYFESVAEWPTRSPDLTSPDFFLWGYLKEKVYISNPKNLEELKISIENEIEKITPEMLINTSDNMIKRVKACLECDGKHFQHLV